MYTEGLGIDMLETGGAQIAYWADAWFTDDILNVRDLDNGKIVRIGPEKMYSVHKNRLWHRFGIKGVHPNNYAFLTDEDDYDADTCDWAIQYIVNGEVLYS